MNRAALTLGCLAAAAALLALWTWLQRADAVRDFQAEQEAAAEAARAEHRTQAQETQDAIADLPDDALLRAIPQRLPVADPGNGSSFQGCAEAPAPDCP